MKKFTKIIERFEQNIIRDGLEANEAKEAFGQAKPDDLNNFTLLYETFAKWSAFYEEKDLENLKSYSIPETIVTFYRNFEPQNLPALSGGIRLLGLEQIKEENASAVPSMFFVKFGLLTVATTIGGNVICLDLNEIKNDEPSVLIADHSFCSYNDDLDVIECVIVPDDIADNYSDDEPIVLTYDLIKRCLPQVADSFSDFLNKLANEEYVDIENEYL
ncbi:SMI1/KNR4 family protein [Lysinibacillus mangiferihumi]|nr:SMI1/KNR4 family protein [Lysinibacillus mangiferihumi]